MNKNWCLLLLFSQLILVSSCEKEEPELGTNPGGLPTAGNAGCKVQEIEFRNDADEITGIREFNYDVNQNNRLKSISIVEGFDSDPVSLRFQFNYRNGDQSIVPTSIDEVFGADILTTITFTFNTEGNLLEFTQHQVLSPTVPPESHLFFYEPTEFANDSINTRIIMFDIENLTRDWIDVFPAIFTTGGQRITRFDRVTFRGDLLEFCDFSYNEQGYLEEIVCRTVEGLLSEVWSFTYRENQLISAFQQLPNFRAISTYEYDDQGKPVLMESTTDGRFNWKGAYFYLCR